MRDRHLFGAYKKLRNEFTGILRLTGKGVNWVGSFIRPEATDYGGLVYFVEHLSIFLTFLFYFINDLFSLFSLLYPDDRQSLP